MIEVTTSDCDKIYEFADKLEYISKQLKRKVRCFKDGDEEQVYGGHRREDDDDDDDDEMEDRKSRRGKTGRY